jgi:signal transduction histidine kinase
MADTDFDPRLNGSGPRTDRETAPPPEPLPASDEGVNILLVDDRPEQLLVLETILSGLGQNLIRAGSGRDALRFLLNHDCALILLDVNMPDIDGFETAALIRQRPRTRQTPIIFVTAYDETETHVSRGYSLGAVDYIQTPVVPDVLAAKASVFVELARSTQQVRRAAEQLELRVQERTEQLRSLNQALQAEIVERERAAAERDRLLADAQEGVRRRDELLATLAHELRNPLAAIVNGAELMGLLGLPSAQHEEAREIIERQGRHMSHLLEDLLDVSRLTRGKIELRKQTVDLGRILEEALEAKRGEFAETGHEPLLTQPQERLLVQADPTRMLQVFDNLLENAGKYTPAGGRIIVDVDSTAGHAVVRIRDTGIGIAPDRLTQIFEPFVQLNQSHVRPSAGLGIGLTLVRRLVELHGGRVSASSAGRGLGSEFTVTLPLHRAPDGDAGPEPTNGKLMVEHTLTARKVVLVEDNSDARQLLSRLLGCSGHRVEEAGDGPSGVDAIRRARPDLALIDIGLPGFDGYQVAAQVRADPECRHVRLIAMTGYGQPEDCRRALAAGFDAHLVKPVRADELTRVLELQPASA